VTEISRRDWLKDVGAVTAGYALASQTREIPANGTIVPRTSTTGVFVPPRGRSFQKFSFDFPEPSVAFDGHEFSFRIFTHENTYALSAPQIRVTATDRGLEIACAEFVWAGGQERTPGRLTAQVTRASNGDIDCAATAEMDRPVKAVAMILRGVPRGRVSAGGAPFFDPRDDEVLLGYPFQGGDLFGPQGNGGLTTPLVLVQPTGGDAIVALSALDDRVRTKRFY
jgi:hypothetical protein